MNLAFIQGIGPLELVIVLAIVLLVLGPKRLPGLGRSLGSGIRELRGSIGKHDDDSDSVDAVPKAAAAPPARPVRAGAEEHVHGEVVPERR